MRIACVIRKQLTFYMFLQVTCYMQMVTHCTYLSLAEHLLQVLDANTAATIHIKGLKGLLHPIMPFLAVLYFPPVHQSRHPAVIPAADHRVLHGLIL